MAERTPLHSPQYCRLEGNWEPHMHRAGFLPLALQSLEIVQAALARNLALELFEAIERHSCSISSGRTTVRKLRKGSLESWGTRAHSYVSKISPVWLR